MQLIQKQCLYCNSTFLAVQKHPCRKPKDCCSRSCQIKHNLSQTDRPPWSIEEQEFLAEIVDTLPRRQLHKKYNRWAKKKGYKERSLPAIYNRIKSLRPPKEQHKTYDGITDGWSLKEACRQLGVSLVVIQKTWRKLGLKIKRDGRNWIITRDALKQLARRHPEAFTLIHPYRLHAVLGNAKLVAKITKLPPPTQGRKHRVICEETGEIFPSMTAAAKAKFIDIKTISNSVRKQRPTTVGTFKLLTVDTPDYAEYC